MATTKFCPLSTAKAKGTQSKKSKLFKEESTMRDKLIKVGLGVTGVSSGTIILISVGAYEQGIISGYNFFWQMTVGILLLLLILISCLYLDLERDYIELSEDFNDYLDVEEAEEIRIPQEEFKFTIPEGSDTE